MTEMRRWSTIVLLCAAAVSAAAQTTTPQPEVPTLLMSRPLLESQGLRPGDIVSISADPTGANPRQFRIAAEYEPMPDPMRLGAVRHEVRLHLPRQPRGARQEDNDE